MNNRQRKTWYGLGLSLVLISLAAGAQAAADANEGVRQSVTSQGLVSAGGAAADAEPSANEHEALSIGGSRGKTTRSGEQQKVAGSNQRTPNTDFWIYSADVDLFLDQDNDGYFTGIDLLFDADSYYDVADVYAVLYLSYEYGPWNEYAETDTFTIYGAAAGDEYVVETDLVQGYPTGNYDILIELYDVYDNALVATLGPEDTSELALLPLEDIGRDSPTGTTQVVVNSGGGGSSGWFLILTLLGASALVRRQRVVVAD